MNSISKVLLIFIFVFGLSLHSYATITLNVDTAPNVYDSPNWAPWWNQTKDDVVNDNFLNMRSSLLNRPGELKMDPYDEIIYSTMDLGKRLHWIYWLPEETTSSLEDLFQVKWIIDWRGGNYYSESDVWHLDSPDRGWNQPTNWENYNDGQGNSGVIGSFGFAWWAWDGSANPGDTGGSFYDETDMADVNAMWNLISQYQTFAKGTIRYRSSVNDDWQFQDLQVDVVANPEPSTFLLLGFGFLGFGVIRRIRKKNSQL